MKQPIKKSAIDPIKRMYEFLSPQSHELERIADAKDTVSYGSL